MFVKDQSMRWSSFFIVVLPVLASRAVATKETIYVRPTTTLNVSNSYAENGNLTLNKLIASINSTFLNGTTVTLLAGIHHINSTKDKVLIENVQSLVLTGEHKETIESYVVGFHFNFSASKDVSIFGLAFNSCELVFSRSTQFENVTLINSRLKIYPYKSHPSGAGQGEIRCCGLQERVSISNSVFQNSVMYVGNDVCFSSAESCTCFSVQLSTVLFENVDSRTGDNVLHIHDITEVTLTDVTFNTNVFPLSNMLFLSEINEVKFGGYCTFSKNRGYDGVMIINVADVMFSSSSRIELSSNAVTENLLHFISDAFNGNSEIAFTNCDIIFEDNTSEQGNILTVNWPLLTATNTHMFFINNTCSTFSSMSSNSVGAIMLLTRSKAELFYSHLVFRHNSSPLSGGMTLVKSSIVFKNSNATIEYNVGGDGGAMAFYGVSYIKAPSSSSGCCNRDKDNPACQVYDSCISRQCFENVFLNIRHNRARRRGGGIFVKDSDYINSVSRTQNTYIVHRDYEAEDDLCRQGFVPPVSDITVYMSNNSAKLGGNDVYGGWVDAIEAFISIDVHWNLLEDDLHSVTSNPTRVCLCNGSVPTCDVTEYRTQIHHGETLAVRAVAVGQRLGIVPSVVIAEFTDDEGSLGEGQSVQNVHTSCTEIRYTVFSTKDLKVMYLTAQNLGTPNTEYLSEFLPVTYHKLFKQLSVTINFKECPLGFYFNLELKVCSCLPQIELTNGLDCDNKTFMIRKAKQKWLSSHCNTARHGIVIHDQCPHDYCRDNADPLSFHLESPDEQCAFQRSGVLCGACEHGLSQVLGSSKCTKCSNLMLLAIIPATIVAGILIVGFLIVINLTVTAGTINGLIFYANIIRASQAVFFPPGINTSFLSTFIAWLNLDLGIQTCFYDGLDAYAKTWLQFVFPLYIWLVVIIVIVSSHYSTTVSRFTPSNALQVLATLFLLSYAKILRVIITVFSSTNLLCPGDVRKRVWLYDGNVEFLTGKHVPLFIVTLLLLILLSVPFTLSLISIQWLQRISHYRPLFWVHRLLPLFDAYTGPYKIKHRYWTGMLLLVRVIILIIVTFTQNRPAVNLITIAVTTLLLFTYLSYIGTVYKKWLHNILETISLLNLGFLSVATYYQLFNDRSAVSATTVSTGLAFVTFVFVSAYHAVQQLASQNNLKSQLTVHRADVIGRIQKLGRKKKQGGNFTAYASGDDDQEISHTSIELHDFLIPNSSDQGSKID